MLYTGSASNPPPVSTLKQAVLKHSKSVSVSSMKRNISVSFSEKRDEQLFPEKIMDSCSKKDQKDDIANHTSIIKKSASSFTIEAQSEPLDKQSMQFERARRSNGAPYYQNMSDRMKTNQTSNMVAQNAQQPIRSRNLNSNNTMSCFMSIKSPNTDLMKPLRQQ